MRGFLGILRLCRKLCKIEQYFLGVIADSFKDSPKWKKVIRFGLFNGTFVL